MDFCGLEKLSLVDFDDNISCTLFMSGCPFRCPFCHNGGLVLDPSSNKTIPWSEIMDYLRKRDGVLEAVVITGGEPTTMPDLIDKIKDIKSLGLKVKLDTNGFNPKAVKELISLQIVDYFAMDIKNSPSKYAKTIGLSKAPLREIEESMHLIMESGIPYEFRTTSINEFHDEESFKEIAKWIKGAKRYFIQKYIDREGCIERGFHEIEKRQAEAYLSLVREYVPEAQLRGY